MYTAHLIKAILINCPYFAAIIKISLCTKTIWKNDIVSVRISIMLIFSYPIITISG